MKQPMTVQIAYTSEQVFLKKNCPLFQPLMSNTILVTCRINFFFPMLLIFLIYTTSLSFIMVKGKFSPIFTPNTLESMIEYILISSILERICEMSTNLWECQRDDSRLLLFQHLLEIRTWGKKWKKIDKTNEWAAW